MENKTKSNIEEINKKDLDKGLKSLKSILDSSSIEENSHAISFLRYYYKEIEILHKNKFK